MFNPDNPTVSKQPGQEPEDITLLGKNQESGDLKAPLESSASGDKLENKISNQTENPPSFDAMAENLLANPEMLKQPEAIEKITEVVSAIDKHCDMVRKAWDKMPADLQWAIRFADTRSPTPSPIDMMIKLGMLTFKGHLDKGGNINETKIKKESELEQLLLKYGVKLGKWVFPELAALEPFVEPLNKLKGVQDDILSTVRRGVTANRENRLAEEAAMKGSEEKQEATA